MTQRTASGSQEKQPNSRNSTRDDPDRRDANHPLTKPLRDDEPVPTTSPTGSIHTPTPKSSEAGLSWLPARSCLPFNQRAPRLRAHRHDTAPRPDRTGRCQPNSHSLSKDDPNRRDAAYLLTNLLRDDEPARTALPTGSHSHAFAEVLVSRINRALPAARP